MYEIYTCFCTKFPDFCGFPSAAIKAHDTEFDGRGKAQILRKKKGKKKSPTLNVELSTEIGFARLLE